jgi:hypothetical protein
VNQARIDNSSGSKAADPILNSKIPVQNPTIQFQNEAENTTIMKAREADRFLCKLAAEDERTGDKKSTNSNQFDNVLIKDDVIRDKEVLVSLKEEENSKKNCIFT